MALMLEDKKPFYSFTESSLKLAIFAAHAVSSIIMLLKATGTFDTGCDSIALLTSRMVTKEDPYVMSVKPALMELPINRLKNQTDCSNDTSWNQGWCRGQNLPPYYEYEADINSFVLGSSWNVIFAVTVFEWITASYALFYIDPFDYWLDWQPLMYGLHPVPVLCTLWNLVLILLMWIMRYSLNVPPNNAFIYTLALAVTIVIQNVLSINRNWRIDNEKEEPITYKETSCQAASLRTDLFLRKRKTDGYKQLAPVRSSTYDFHQANYMILFEKCCCSPLPRYMEYMITAPILLVALYASSVPNDVTWKFQFIAMALLACNAIGVPLHYSVLNISIDLVRFTKAAAYLLLSSWLCLLVGLYIFVWTLRDFLIGSDSGMPQWVQILIWLMVILYAMFGVAASRYYLPKIMWDSDYGPDEYRWLAFYFDIFSLAIKLPVAWTIWLKGAVMMCEQGASC
jgi:hypothetical protein